MTFMSATRSFEDREQVLAVFVPERPGEPLDLLGVDEAHPVGDLFEAGDLQPLAVLDRPG